MRWYKLFIGDKLVASLSAESPNAPAIEFNIEHSLTRNNPDTQITVFNAPLTTFTEQNNLNGQTLTLFAGMDGFLPIVTPSQRGLIFNGIILAHYAFFNGKDTSIVLNCYPYQDVDKDKSFILKVLNGELLHVKLRPLLHSLHVKFEFGSGALKVRAKNKQVLKIVRMRDIFNFLENYGIEAKTNKNGLFFATKDDVPIRKPIVLQKKDMVGQPEATDGAVAFFLQMRADIDIGDTIVFNLPAFINFTQATMVGTGAFGVNYNTTQLYSMYSGDFSVKQIRYVGQSNNPSGGAWTVIVEASRTNIGKKI